jgi:hypothetical protein
VPGGIRGGYIQRILVRGTSKCVDVFFVPTVYILKEHQYQKIKSCFLQYIAKTHYYFLPGVIKTKINFG